MKIAATFHLNGLLDEQANLDRLEREHAALQQLDSNALDALCSVLDAGDAGELVPKLYRLALVGRQPDTLVTGMLAGDPGALVTFAFELASYRLFMDRLLAGNETPRDMAGAVEREQRAWLRRLIARFRDPAELLPDPESEPAEDLP
jgi:hypothetical protein